MSAGTIFSAVSPNLLGKDMGKFLSFLALMEY